jgi:hypothetical protein
MRCPVCRAENELNAAGVDATCRRCRADLTLVAAVERQRVSCLAEADRLLRAGDVAAAETQAEQAHRLRAGADSARRAALACLLGRRFAAAVQWRARARFSGGTP